MTVLFDLDRNQTLKSLVLMTLVFQFKWILIESEMISILYFLNTRSIEMKIQHQYSSESVNILYFSFPISLILFLVVWLGKTCI